MKNSTFIKTVGLGLWVALSSLATPALAFMPQVGVFGPEGLRIAYEKVGDKIHIRLFKNDSLKKEIKDPENEGKERIIQEFTISEEEFRENARVKLAEMDQSKLSEEQQTLLRRYLTELPNLREDQKRMAELEAKIRRFEAAQKDEPNDYGKAEHDQTIAELQRLKERLAGQTNELQAKADMAALLDTLLTEMQGKPLEKVLRHSEVGNGIEFNLLNEIAFNFLIEIVSFQKCSDLSSKSQGAGAMCETSRGDVFLRVTEPEAGWKDLASNRTWFDAIYPLINRLEAGSLCNKLDQTLPSKEDFESLLSNFVQDSDGQLTDEGRSEFHALFPSMRDKWFWSDTRYPQDSDLACSFGGEYGVFDDRTHSLVALWARCVSEER